MSDPLTRTGKFPECGKQGERDISTETLAALLQVILDSWKYVTSEPVLVPYLPTQFGLVAHGEVYLSDLESCERPRGKH